MAFVPVGAMISGLIGNQFIEPYGCEGLFLALGAIAVVAAIVLLAFLPESPVFLAHSAAGQKRLRAVVERCGFIVGMPRSRRRIRAPVKGRTPLAVLFAGSSTIFLWIAFFFCLLANYAMFSWVPAMLASLGFALSLTGLGMTFLSLGGAYWAVWAVAG